jgi:hypothetical protein
VTIVKVRASHLLYFSEAGRGERAKRNDEVADLVVSKPVLDEQTALPRVDEAS